MKIAITAFLFAEWNVNVYTGQFNSFLEAQN